MRRLPQGSTHHGSPVGTGIPGVLARLRVAARRESALFLLGIGVIGVHVLDDNFLQPPPGTTAGDHLVSGLVPLAMVVLAGAVYSRLRAGFRAVIALTLGFLAVVGGAAEAGYYTVKVGAAARSRPQSHFAPGRRRRLTASRRASASGIKAHTAEKCAA